MFVCHSPPPPIPNTYCSLIHLLEPHVCPIIDCKSCLGCRDNYVQETEKDVPFGEDLAVIKDLEIKSLKELFPNQLDQQFITQIQQAQNYRQLVEIRNSLLAKHLAKVQKEKNGNFNQTKKTIQSLPELPFVKSNAERTILISLLAVSLISISGLLVKLSKTRKK